MKIVTKEEEYKKLFQRYFTKNFDHFKKFVDIINKRTNYSTRIIEHFVIVYARKNHTMFHTLDNRYIQVYSAYKTVLKGYHKDYLDSFRRKKDGKDVSFLFTIKDLTVLTTISQLNFFRWLFQNEIINYIENNLEQIDADLKKTDKEKQKVKEEKKKRRQQQQQQQPIKAN